MKRPKDSTISSFIKDEKNSREMPPTSLETSFWNVTCSSFFMSRRFLKAVRESARRFSRLTVI